MHQQSGHLGYPQDSIPVFHPGFEAWCDRSARRLAATPGCSATSPTMRRPLRLTFSTVIWLSTLRTPTWRTAVMRARLAVGAQGPNSEITAEDRESFRGFVFERYFALTVRAIRTRSTPPVPGPRMHGPLLKSATSSQLPGSTSISWRSTSTITGLRRPI